MMNVIYFSLNLFCIAQNRLPWPSKFLQRSSILIKFRDYSLVPD